MSIRSKARRFRLGLSTLFGSRRGFFIPHRYADRLSAPGSRPPYDLAERRFAGLMLQFASHLESIEGFAESLRAIGGQPPPAPRWEQDWYPRLDAAMAYAMVRRHRP